MPVIGPLLQRLGIFHMMADGGKLLFKEDVVPGHVNKFYFLAAPILALIPAFTTATVVPFGAYWDAAAEAFQPIILADVDVGLLAIFAISSLGVYSVILAGWASNSKYPFLGGVRASAQLISYELSMTLAVLPVFLWINAPGQEATLSLFAVVQAQAHVADQEQRRRAAANRAADGTREQAVDAVGAALRGDAEARVVGDVSVDVADR